MEDLQEPSSPKTATDDGSTKPPPVQLDNGQDTIMQQFSQGPLPREESSLATVAQHSDPGPSLSKRSKDSPDARRRPRIARKHRRSEGSPERLPRSSDEESCAYIRYEVLPYPKNFPTETPFSQRNSSPIRTRLSPPSPKSFETPSTKSSPSRVGILGEQETLPPWTFPREDTNNPTIETGALTPRKDKSVTHDVPMLSERVSDSSGQEQFSSTESQLLPLPVCQLSSEIHPSSSYQIYSEAEKVPPESIEQENYPTPPSMESCRSQSPEHLKWQTHAEKGVRKSPRNSLRLELEQSRNEQPSSPGTTPPESNEPVQPAKESPKAERATIFERPHETGLQKLAPVIKLESCQEESGLDEQGKESHGEQIFSPKKDKPSSDQPLSIIVDLPHLSVPGQSFMQSEQTGLSICTLPLPPFTRELVSPPPRPLFEEASRAVSSSSSSKSSTPEGSPRRESLPSNETSLGTVPERDDSKVCSDPGLLEISEAQRKPVESHLGTSAQSTDLRPHSSSSSDSERHPSFIQSQQSSRKKHFSRKSVTTKSQSVAERSDKFPKITITTADASIERELQSDSDLSTREKTLDLTQEIDSSSAKLPLSPTLKESSQQLYSEDSMLMPDSTVPEGSSSNTETASPQTSKAASSDNVGRSSSVAGSQQSEETASWSETTSEEALDQRTSLSTSLEQVHSSTSPLREVLQSTNVSFQHIIQRIKSLEQRLGEMGNGDTGPNEQCPSVQPPTYDRLESSEATPASQSTTESSISRSTREVKGSTPDSSSDSNQSHVTANLNAPLNFLPYLQSVEDNMRRYQFRMRVEVPPLVPEGEILRSLLTRGREQEQTSSNVSDLSTEVRIAYPKIKTPESNLYEADSTQSPPESTPAQNTSTPSVEPHEGEARPTLHLMPVLRIPLQLLEANSTTSQAQQSTGGPPSSHSRDSLPDPSIAVAPRATERQKKTTVNRVQRRWRGRRLSIRIRHTLRRRSASRQLSHILLSMASRCRELATTLGSQPGSQQLPGSLSSTNGHAQPSESRRPCLPGTQQAQCQEGETTRTADPLVPPPSTSQSTTSPIGSSAAQQAQLIFTPDSRELVFTGTLQSLDPTRVQEELHGQTNGTFEAVQFAIAFEMPSRTAGAQPSEVQVISQLPTDQSPIQEGSVPVANLLTILQTPQYLAQTQQLLSAENVPDIAKQTTEMRASVQLPLQPVPSSFQTAHVPSDELNDMKPNEGQFEVFNLDKHVQHESEATEYSEGQKPSTEQSLDSRTVALGRGETSESFTLISLPTDTDPVNSKVIIDTLTQLAYVSETLLEDTTPPEEFYAEQLELHKSMSTYHSEGSQSEEMLATGSFPGQIVPAHISDQSTHQSSSYDPVFISEEMEDTGVLPHHKEESPLTELSLEENIAQFSSVEVESETLLLEQSVKSPSSSTTARELSQSMPTLENKERESEQRNAVTEIPTEIALPIDELPPIFDLELDETEFEKETGMNLERLSMELNESSRNSNDSPLVQSGSSDFLVQAPSKQSGLPGPEEKLEVLAFMPTSKDWHTSNGPNLMEVSELEQMRKIEDESALCTVIATLLHKSQTEVDTSMENKPEQPVQASTPVEETKDYSQVLQSTGMKSLESSLPKSRVPYAAESSEEQKSQTKRSPTFTLSKTPEKPLAKSRSEENEAKLVKGKPTPRSSKLGSMKQTPATQQRPSGGLRENAPTSGVRTSQRAATQSAVKSTREQRTLTPQRRYSSRSENLDEAADKRKILTPPSKGRLSTTRRSSHEMAPKPKPTKSPAIQPANKPQSKSMADTKLSQRKQSPQIKSTSSRTSTSPRTQVTPSAKTVQTRSMLNTKTSEVKPIRQSRSDPTIASTPSGVKTRRVTQPRSTPTSRDRTTQRATPAKDKPSAQKMQVSQFTVSKKSEMSEVKKDSDVKTKKQSTVRSERETGTADNSKRTVLRTGRQNHEAAAKSLTVHSESTGAIPKTAQPRPTSTKKPPQRKAKSVPLHKAADLKQIDTSQTALSQPCGVETAIREPELNCFEAEQTFLVSDVSTESLFLQTIHQHQTSTEASLPLTSTRLLSPRREIEVVGYNIPVVPFPYRISPTNRRSDLPILLVPQSTGLSEYSDRQTLASRDLNGELLYPPGSGYTIDIGVPTISGAEPPVAGISGTFPDHVESTTMAPSEPTVESITLLEESDVTMPNT